MGKSVIYLDDDFHAFFMRYAKDKDRTAGRLIQELVAPLIGYGHDKDTISKGGTVTVEINPKTGKPYEPGEILTEVDGSDWIMTPERMWQCVADIKPSVKETKPELKEINGKMYKKENGRWELADVYDLPEVAF